jgi:hypothetical protein
MELGKPIRTVIVEPVADPKQQTVTRPREEVGEREPRVLRTTPSR